MWCSSADPGLNLRRTLHRTFVAESLAGRQLDLVVAQNFCVEARARELGRRRVQDVARTLGLLEGNALHVDGAASDAVPGRGAQLFLRRGDAVRALLAAGANYDLRNEMGHDAEAHARWCARGCDDPDLKDLGFSGQTQSPTLSFEGIMLALQLIASFGWSLELGDVRGAFMESGKLRREAGKVYASLPRGGIPGTSLRPDQLVEILTYLYGLNDAPRAWWATVEEFLTTLCGRTARLQRHSYGSKPLLFESSSVGNDPLADTTLHSHRP